MLFLYNIDRAERSEIAAQPTLSTTARRAQQQQAEGEASRPLKWACAYSFKYRYIHTYHSDNISIDDITRGIF